MPQSIPHTASFETERDASEASLYYIEGGPGCGLSIAKSNLADLEAATSSLTLGAYDRRILAWLAGWEPAIVAVVCGLIRRARLGQAPPADPESGKLAAIRAVLDAFDWEHDDRQYALERIDQIASGSRTASGIEPGGSAHITAADLPTVLDALDIAADYKRERADTCSDCNADPADLCAACEWRLHLASEYDSLADRLRS